MALEPPTTCPRCGSKIPAGEECAKCADSKVFRLVHREVFLLLLLAAIALGAYFGTRAFANANRDMKAHVALSWYQQGQRLLTAGHADQAVAAFRKAAVNDRGNRRYTRALARALEMDGRDTEALEVLIQLRDTAPEDPDINVDLGRIAVRQGNLQEAIRYYHNALYGIWAGDDIDLRRTQVRRELIEFLLAHHARDQALAEILALTAHLPNTPASDLELGDLLLRAGDPQRALSYFRPLLHEEAHNQAALRGAGEAAFEVGDYRSAYRLLSTVTTADAATKARLAVATLVVENDPLAPRLTDRERYRRLVGDFDRTAQHLQDCLKIPTTSNAAPLKSLSDELAGMRPSLTAVNLGSDPNLIFNALELIYEAEETATQMCGQPQGMDEALLLMAQKDRRAEQ